MNESHKTMINELAKSTMTVEVYTKRLEVIATINKQWAEYLDGHKHEYVAAFFLQKGYRRWGKVTSNGVESINGVLSEARSYGIVFLMEHIVKYQRKKYHERYLNACKWSTEGKLITEYARDIQMKLADSAAKRDVEILESNHPVYRARVESSTAGDVLHLRSAISPNHKS
jgi:hypothetical protein